MKIENRGIKITEIPYLHRIETLPDAEPSAVLDGDYRISLPDLTELRDALTVAIDYLTSPALITPAPATPRKWDAGSEEPDDVTKVRDRTGDLWFKTLDGWGMGEYGGEDSWEYLVGAWGPVTEVLDAD